MHQPLVPILTLAAARYLFDAFDAPSRLRTLRALPLGAVALALWIMVSPALGGVYVMPGPRHTGAAQLLALGRHVPLPGAERSAWMLAGVEASAGREDEARRILEQPAWGEDPWSLYLRALLARRPDEAARLLDRALERDPDLWAAQVARSELGRAR
jgi:hypothetical protein